MSAWDRLSPEYRALCEEIVKNSPGNLSPQNKRVRQVADRVLAERRERERRPAGVLAR